DPVGVERQDVLAGDLVPQAEGLVPPRDAQGTPYFSRRSTASPGQSHRPRGGGRHWKLELMRRLPAEYGAVPSECWTKSMASRTIWSPLTSSSQTTNSPVMALLPRPLPRKSRPGAAPLKEKRLAPGYGPTARDCPTGAPMSINQPSTLMWTPRGV